VLVEPLDVEGRSISSAAIEPDRLSQPFPLVVDIGTLADSSIENVENRNRLLHVSLSGKIASATPFVTDFQHGMSGKATPRDLETALQLTHLVFTAPDDRPDAFQVVMGQLRRLGISVCLRVAPML
jgi:zinc protease